MNFSKFGFENLVVDTTEGGKFLDVSKYEGAKKATISVETSKVRFRVDGEAPTASIGHPCDVDDTIELDSIEEIRNFRVISTAEAGSTLNITYFK